MKPHLDWATLAVAGIVLTLPACGLREAREDSVKAETRIMSELGVARSSRATS